MRITALPIVLATFALTSATYAQSSAPKSDRKPNIIYFYADDLGYGETGPYGQKKIKTPNVDKLAAEGMKFTRHYTGAPVCAAARCMLMTGLHSGHAVVRGNYEFGGFEDEKEGGQLPLPPSTRTIGTMLKESGYATGCIGKWGLGNTGTSGQPNRQGFDYFFGYLDQKQAHNYYPTHLWENDQVYPLNNKWVDIHEHRKGTGAVDPAPYQQGDHACDHMTSKALAFIEKHKDEPFFLYYSTPVPHLSLQPKKEFVDQYVGKLGDDPAYHGHKGYAPVEHPRAAYAAMISMMDADLGNLMAKIKELGLDENTIIMLSSDNGPTWNLGGVDRDFFESAGGLRGGKRELYEGGIREPMIARWPGHIKGGSVTDHPSTQYDLMPTLADLTGAKASQPCDGISFLPTLLDNGTQKKHEALYWEFPENGGQVAVQKGDWKAIRTGVTEDVNAPWQLYNLKTDEKEANDVAAANPEVIKELDAFAKSNHWHPQVREFEFIDPKFDPKLTE